VFVSHGGALVTTSASNFTGQLGYFQHDETFHPLLAQPRGYYLPRFSPDGKRIATLVLESDQVDLWILDLTTNAFTRVTASGNLSGLEWRPDGKALFTTSARGDFAIVPASGGGAPQYFAHLGELGNCATMSPRGDFAVVSLLHDNSWDLFTVSADSTVRPKPFVVTPGTDWAPRFSPDGNWVAFSSDMGTASEVYVRSFPDGQTQLQISAGGGQTPSWSPDGKAIYYMNAARLIRARTSGPPSFQLLGRDTVARAIPDFSATSCAPDFDVSPDGSRIMTTRAEHHGTRIIAVPNWIVEMRERIRGGSPQH
jgi:WD40 repeat protein